MDSLTRLGLEAFRNEVIPQIRQALKETGKKDAVAQARGEISAQRPTIEDALIAKENKPASIPSENGLVKGEGWTAKDGGVVKQYAQHKFEVEKWVNDLSGVLSDEWAANLKTLALKHPEMFKSEADVFRVIKEIKDNPTHFFKNNREDAALIAKELKDGKVGNIAIKKDDGEIVHVNKTRKSDLVRLQRNNEKALEGTPTPSILDAGINPTQTRRFAATPNDEIILHQTQNLAKTGIRQAKAAIKEETKQAVKSEAKSPIALKEAVEKQLNFIDKNNLGKDGWLDDIERVIKKYGLDELKTKNEFMRIMVTDKFKNGREFNRPSVHNVMPKISPLNPKYHEILNGAHKELNEILKNKTIPATRQQYLKFYSSNPHIGSGLAAGALNSKDENGNFDPERFARGFLAGAVGSKGASIAYNKLASFRQTAKNIKSLTSIISKMNDSKKVGEIMLKAAHNKDISARNKIHILNAAAKRISELESKAK